MRRTGSGVSTKVEEELEESEACEEGTFSNMVNFTCENAEEHSCHAEAHELEPFTTDNIDGEEGKVVAGKEPKSRDNDLKGM
jgi:hypothetical protein